MESMTEFNILIWKQVEAGRDGFRWSSEHKDDAHEGSFSRTASIIHSFICGWCNHENSWSIYVTDKGNGPSVGPQADRQVIVPAVFWQLDSEPEELHWHNAATAPSSSSEPGPPPPDSRTDNQVRRLPAMIHRKCLYMWRRQKCYSPPSVREQVRVQWSWLRLRLPLARIRSPPRRAGHTDTPH